MLGPQTPDVVAEPGDRPRPTDPLGDHRRRHVRRLLERLAYGRFERRERRRHRPGRSYLGGRSEASALSTVDLPIPRSRATWRRGTPSGTSRPDQSPILH